MSAGRHILPVIVIAQFCCTSLWFAGNAILDELLLNFNLNGDALGHITSAVQLGFISGTFTFALLSITDRFSPSKVFFTSALLGSAFNLGIIWDGNTLASILFLRFATGFFLAGIYPVGMKIAADHYNEGLGKSLGFLVGALTLGTAFPHLAKEVTGTLPWKAVLIVTSSLAALGGLLISFFVPDGPYRTPAKTMDISAIFSVFANRNRDFRSAAMGYFGHMWELYAFWAFVPILLKTYFQDHHQFEYSVPFLSFLIIGLGALACVLGGYLAQWMGVKKVALIALSLSCACCLVSPWMFTMQSPALFVDFLVFWGMVVIMDSPLFSTLVALNAVSEIKGTTLTIVNCFGFAITIVSIQLLGFLLDFLGPTHSYQLLAFGPIIGLINLLKKQR